MSHLRKMPATLAGDSNALMVGIVDIVDILLLPIIVNNKVTYDTSTLSYLTMEIG